MKDSGFQFKRAVKGKKGRRREKENKTKADF